MGVEDNAAGLSRYSYRRAVIGSRLAARRAGQIPKNRPMMALNPNAMMIDVGETSTFQCASFESSTAAPVPAG